MLQAKPWSEKTLTNSHTDATADRGRLDEPEVPVKSHVTPEDQRYSIELDLKTSKFWPPAWS